MTKPSAEEVKSSPAVVKRSPPPPTEAGAPSRPVLRRMRDLIYENEAQMNRPPAEKQLSHEQLLTRQLSAVNMQPKVKLVRLSAEVQLHFAYFLVHSNTCWSIVTLVDPY